MAMKFDAESNETYPAISLSQVYEDSEMLTENDVRSWFVKSQIVEFEKRNIDRYGISDLCNVGDRIGFFCSDSMDVIKSTKRDCSTTILVIPPVSPCSPTCSIHAKH